MNLNFPPGTQQVKAIPNHQQNGNGFYIAQFKLAELAVYSYYVQSENQAVLIDPIYDVRSYHSLLQDRKSKLTNIILTHYHADFISGHSQFNVPIVMGVGSSHPETTLKISQQKDGERLKLGSIEFMVIHTPGHTPQSSCFKLFDKDGKQFCIFTGDTLFLGQVGRPDLAASSQQLTKQILAGQLFHSLQKLKKEVNLETRIYPGHGAGSSCGKSISDGKYCFMKKQIQTNYALQIQTQAQFITKLLSQMAPPPKYFFYDAKLNKEGPSPFIELFNKANVRLNEQQFESQFKKGAILIDVRGELIGGCIKGALIMPEKATVSTWVGTMIDPKDNILIFCDEGKVQEVIERFLRVGFSNIKGINKFTMDGWKGKGFAWYEPKIVSIKDIVGLKDINVLDVRNLPEWKQTGVVEKAITIPMKDIGTRIQQVRNIPHLYVHCLSGNRARLAGSILSKNGIDCTIIVDKFQAFGENGFKITPYS